MATAGNTEKRPVNGGGEPGFGNRGVVMNPYSGRPTGIASAGALGLLAFAATSFLFGLYFVHTRSVTLPNAAVGMALFTGGLIQLLAGMWSFPRGNLFSATFFSAYAAFWLAFGTILIPGSGVMSAFSSDTRELDNAVGLFLITWMLVSIYFLVASLRIHIGYAVLFFFLTLSYALSGAYYLRSTSTFSLAKAGGAFGIISSLVAWYISLSELLAGEAAPLFKAPLGSLAGTP